MKPEKLVRNLAVVCAVLMFSAALAAQQSHRASPHRAAAAHTTAEPWWKSAVIYEIYPRSFQDSNGDGIGDLNGITQRLDYLRELGVDAIWIAPMFPSPQVDFGYDISDYRNVDPQYGTLQDFDRLTREARKRGIRIVLDMVLNHTSDKHPWFVESAASRSNPRADWFVWNDGVPAAQSKLPARYMQAGMAPPNNWISLFGGSAWQWHPARKQFYYHDFYVQQPDLNWRNPAVETAMFGEMKFWLDRGVAGFRLDAVPSMFEDPALHDNPETGGTTVYGDRAVETEHTNNLPEVHDVMRRMRSMTDTYPDHRVLIGETYLPDIAALDKWYGGAAHDELQLPMDMMLGFRGSSFTAAYLRKAISEAETQLHGSQPLFVFDNHDNPRSWDRVGDGVHNLDIARQVATVLLATRCTALLYYGQEIGMATAPPQRVEDVRDPIGIRGWPQQKGRDGERTPMQWTPAAGAGFSSSARTWLPVQSASARVNVAAERADPQSLLNWYKRLIALRRSEPALRSGETVILNADSPSVLSWMRRSSGARPVFVAINLSDDSQEVQLRPEELQASGRRLRTLMSNDGQVHQASLPGSITLPPHASWIAVLE